MHAFILIPDEASELKLWVLVAILNIGQALMLIDFVVMILAVFAHFILTAITTLNWDSFESFNHRVEVNGVRGEDSELTLIRGVELNVTVLLGLAR